MLAFALIASTVACLATVTKAAVLAPRQPPSFSASTPASWNSASSNGIYNVTGDIKWEGPQYQWIPEDYFVLSIDVQWWRARWDTKENDAAVRPLNNLSISHTLQLDISYRSRS